MAFYGVRFTDRDLVGHHEVWNLGNEITEGDLRGYLCITRYEELAHDFVDFLDNGKKFID